jgi:beta-glucosidase-like glycosyl hydrolase
MMYESKREAKKAHEADIAFHARRLYRGIRRAASIVDPNSGFRLSVSPAIAEKLRRAAARMQEQAVENQKMIAARKAVSARDLAIATKSAEVQKRRLGRI